MMHEITTDDFLGGRLKIRQPKTGFRAGNDALLLAAATPAQAGQSVLELGCGVGTPLLCLAQRVPDLKLTGVEVQPEYAALARENMALNNFEAHIFDADLAALPAELRAESFDHVLTNPPYYDRQRSSMAQDRGRDRALGGEAPMALWVGVAAKRLKPKGYLTLIQHISRLPEVLQACEGRLGSVEILPIVSRPLRAPELFLLRARKAGRAAFKLHFPKQMHLSVSAEHHTDYTDEIRDMQRLGTALTWG